jgi:hypothetical protein
MTEAKRLEENWRKHEAHRPTTLLGYFNVQHPESWTRDGRLRPLKFEEHGREVINIHPFDLYEMFKDKISDIHTWRKNWYGLQVELLEVDDKLYRQTCANPPITTRFA